MKRYTAAQARARLSDVLNDAEAGTPVVIERRGVRFTLARDMPARRGQKARQRTALIEILDPAVEAGEWTWTPARGRLRFTAPAVRSRKK